MVDSPTPRRTKIVATLGPATAEPAALEALVRAGVNVFRLNLSHGDLAWHRTQLKRVRAAGDVCGEPVAVLADLCGPKVRVGTFEGGSIPLKAGDPVTITVRQVRGGPGLIPCSYPDLHNDVHKGDRLVLDDGLLELRVESVEGTEVGCTAVVGGVLRDRKGMNLPGVKVSAPALTAKDRADAWELMGQGVDFLALSFVRSAADVLALKDLVKEAGQTTPVIAKIEKPEAVAAIDEILEACEGIMVARGDLGVELPAEEVPIVQRDLVVRARRWNRPVIVATHMLETMVTSPRPTRAEVSDVSGAVFGGADAVMLSAETSVGAHPLEAVAMLDRVARRAEAWQAEHGHFRPAGGDEGLPQKLQLREAVSRALAQLSRELAVKAVVVRSLQGGSARAVAASRPAAPVLAMSTDLGAVRRMDLLWGVTPVRVTRDEFDQPAEAARQLVKQRDLAKRGEFILLLAGFGKGEPMLTVLPV